MAVDSDRAVRRMLDWNDVRRDNRRYRRRSCGGRHGLPQQREKRRRGSSLAVEIKEETIMKESIMKKTILLFLAACVLGTTFTGCSDDNINKVKSGQMNTFNGLPTGQVFDNYKYFKSKSWRSFKNDDGRNVVEFKGLLELDDAEKKAGIKEVSALFQFIVLKDGTSLLAYVESRTIDKSGEAEVINLTSKSSNLLSEIFANTKLSVPIHGADVN